MDLKVSSYRAQQPAFQGFWNPSATRVCEQARAEKLAKAVNKAVTEGVPGQQAYADILERYNTAVSKLKGFVKKLHDEVGLCSGAGTDAVFKFVRNDGQGSLTYIPTTDIFEKAPVEDAFDAMEYVATKLTSEFQPKDVESLILKKMVTEPTVVDGRQITLRPQSAVLKSAERFARETDNMPLYNSLKETVEKRESDFEREYRLLHNLLDSQK